MYAIEKFSTWILFWDEDLQSLNLIGFSWTIFFKFLNSPKNNIRINLNILPFKAFLNLLHFLFYFKSFGYLKFLWLFFIVLFSLRTIMFMTVLFDFLRFLKDFLRLAYEGKAYHLSRFAMAKLPRRHKTCMRHIFRHTVYTIYTLHKHGFLGYRKQS